MHQWHAYIGVNKSLRIANNIVVANVQKCLIIGFAKFWSKQTLYLSTYVSYCTSIIVITMNYFLPYMTTEASICYVDRAHNIQNKFLGNIVIHSLHSFASINKFPSFAFSNHAHRNTLELGEHGVDIRKPTLSSTLLCAAVWMLFVYA